MDCSPPGSSVHGILQERILERVAIPFSRGSSRQRLYIFEPPEKPPSKSNCILLSLQCDTLDLQWSVTFSFILSSYSLPNFFCCCCYLVKSNNHVWFLCFQRNCFIVINFGGVVVIHSLSCILLFVTPWTAAYQAPLFSPFSWSLLKFVSIESVLLFNHFILCCPLLLLSSIFFSIRVFSNESALIIGLARWR